MTSCNPFRTVALLMALPLCATTAQAVSLSLYSESEGVLGSAVQSPDNKNFSTTDLAQVAAGHLLATSSTSTAGSASGWAIAQPGTLKAYDELLVASGKSALVLERNYAGVVDSLHVDSATLPLGTPVDLQLNLVFTIAFSSSGLTNFMRVGENAILSANDGLHSALLHTDGPTQANGSWGSAIDVVSAVLPTTVGADVTLDQRLAVDGTVEFVDGYGQQLTIDAGHTARFFVDAPAGVILAAATGHDYRSAASVPEPSSTTLMLVGMLALGQLERGRRRQSTASHGSRPTPEFPGPDPHEPEAKSGRNGGEGSAPRGG